MTTAYVEKSAQTGELSSTHSPLGTHGLWGDKSAMLPAYIQNIAKAMIRSGHDESSAIAIAIGSVKRWASGGGKVSPEVRAAAAKAVAEWEKLKAEHSKSKGAIEPDLEKFKIHFNPLQPRGKDGRWIGSGIGNAIEAHQERRRTEREQAKLQHALSGAGKKKDPFKTRLKEPKPGKKGEQEARVEDTTRVVQFHRNLNPDELHPASVASTTVQVRANVGPDKKAPGYLRSDVHVLMTSQKYTDAQVVKLQKQLDDLRNEQRKDESKSKKFENALRFGAVIAGIGLELFHGNDPATLAVFGTLLFSKLPELMEPIIGYAKHIKSNSEGWRPTPYAKKSATPEEIAGVQQTIANALRGSGIDPGLAIQYAATVTHAAAESRDAGRREYDDDFISDDQAQRMFSTVDGGSPKAEKSLAHDLAYLTEGRDARGRWEHGGGGGGGLSSAVKLPVEQHGYEGRFAGRDTFTPSMKPASSVKDLMSPGRVDGTGTADDPIDVQGDVDKAVQLMSEGKHVRLNHASEVGVLEDKVNAKADEYAKLGEKMPNWDMGDISVRGSNLFTAQTKGIPRVKMPQLSGPALPGTKAADKYGEGNYADLGDEFRAQLKKDGVKVTDQMVPLNHLRATQTNLTASTVAGIARAAESGNPKVNNMLKEPLWVSKDNYVLDGHHRWAAQMMLSAKNGTLGSKAIEVHRVNMDIGALVPYANQFANDWGIQSVDLGNSKLVESVKKILAFKRDWMSGDVDRLHVAV